MHMAKQFIGEIQKMVKRWEQQISKRRNAVRTTAAATDSHGTQVGPTETRPAVPPEARSPSAARSN